MWKHPKTLSTLWAGKYLLSRVDTLVLTEITAISIILPTCWAVMDSLLMSSMSGVTLESARACSLTVWASCGHHIVIVHFLRSQESHIFLRVASPYVIVKVNLRCIRNLTPGAGEKSRQGIIQFWGMKKWKVLVTPWEIKRLNHSTVMMIWKYITIPVKFTNTSIWFDKSAWKANELCFLLAKKKERETLGWYSIYTTG